MGVWSDSTPATSKRLRGNSFHAAPPAPSNQIYLRRHRRLCHHSPGSGFANFTSAVADVLLFLGWSISIYLKSCLFEYELWWKTRHWKKKIWKMEKRSRQKYVLSLGSVCFCQGFNLLHIHLDHASLTGSRWWINWRWNENLKRHTLRERSVCAHPQSDCHTSADEELGLFDLQFCQFSCEEGENVKKIRDKWRCGRKEAPPPMLQAALLVPGSSRSTAGPPRCRRRRRSTFLQK